MTGYIEGNGLGVGFGVGEEDEGEGSEVRVDSAVSLRLTFPTGVVRGACLSLGPCSLVGIDQTEGMVRSIRGDDGSNNFF